MRSPNYQLKPFLLLASTNKYHWIKFYHIDLFTLILVSLSTMVHNLILSIMTRARIDYIQLYTKLLNNT